jgi:hypothetical protein
MIEREVDFWRASAARHEREGAPVAALISRNLAYQAEQDRKAEYAERFNLANVGKMR